jgi:Fe-S-cluster containining protein
MDAGTTTSAASLCAACGMCCDGVLFHSVVLQRGDSSRALAAAGLKVKRKSGREYFLQPCPAYLGNRCSIYENRPARCRHFNCIQINGMTSGEISEASALATISEARKLASRVNKLIGRLAETNPNRCLAHRYANALTTSLRTPLHRELESAMRELAVLLETQFRVE